MAIPSTYIVAAGSSGKLAKNLGKRLRIPVVPVERTQFMNAEIRLRLQGPVDSKRCLLVATFGKKLHEDIFELMLLADLLRTSGAKEVSAVIPYFPYSRQHKGFRSGESESFGLLCRALLLSGISEVVTVDFHSEEALAACPFPVSNISSLPYLAGLVKSRIEPDSAVAVSPDEGGRSRAEAFATAFGSPCTYVQKSRHRREAHRITSAKLVRGSLVKGKIALLIDDISTSGETLLRAARECARHGAKAVEAIVVHPDMSPSAVKALNASPIRRIVVTNSLELRAAGKKLSVIDITPLLRDVLSTRGRSAPAR